MTPILGILDSAKSGNLGGSAAFDSIATYTATGSVGVITFNSIPQTYKHLQLRVIARNDRTANTGACSDIMYFNNDNGTNYAIHRVQIQGTGNGNITTDGYGSRTGVWCSESPGNQFDGASYAYGICDIVDYTNTNKYTTTKTHFLNNNNWTTAGGNSAPYGSGVWYNTAAVSRIDIVPFGSVAQNYVAGSIFALYGIKG